MPFFKKKLPLPFTALGLLALSDKAQNSVSPYQGPLFCQSFSSFSHSPLLSQSLSSGLIIRSLVFTQKVSALIMLLSLTLLSGVACEEVTDQPSGERGALSDEGVNTPELSNRGLDESLDHSAQADLSTPSEMGSDQTTVENTVSNECRAEGTQYATARCLSPRLDPQYYVDQANAYFDTLDLDADRESIPRYHDQVVRWEWPPWLLLTGYTREEMNVTADVLRRLDPSTVPVRDCRFFEEQPFARCYVVFEYEGRPCPIYEEFIFNDEGEMTWIEAWSDLPGLLPQDESDAWGEGSEYPRLGGRAPGLGQPRGEFDWMSDEVFERSQGDAELIDFMERTVNWRLAWAETLGTSPEDFFAIGCGWE